MMNLPEFRDGKVQIEKQIVFKSTLEIYVYIHDIPVPIEHFENVITKFDFPFCLKDVSQIIEIISYRKIYKAKF